MLVCEDVATVAHAMVERHGDDAPLEAAKVADVYLNQGDFTQGSLYIEVVNACWELLDFS